MSGKVDDRRSGGRCRQCNDIAYRSEADARANKGKIFPAEIGKLLFKACACGLWVVDRLERASDVARP